MLPEFLDEQAELKPSLALPASGEELDFLQVWLSNKEIESNRQVRPAWMEVAVSLCNLVQQRQEDSSEKFSVQKHQDRGLNTQELEQLVFETHLVARQSARQRGERQLPTRFVTDEIKRISNHQLDFINSVKDAKQKVAIIGWYRLSSRRGLGIAIVEQAVALELCNDALSQENQTEIDEYQSEARATRGAKTFRRYKVLAELSLLFFVAALALISIRYSSSLNLNTNSSPNNILGSIKENNLLRCGVDGLLPHFSLRNDAEQKWWGLDVDLCKALGAALNVEVEFIKVSTSQFDQRIDALQKSEVDILFRNTSHTAIRDLNDDIAFGPIYFYEREYFLDFSSIEENTAVEVGELANKNICVKPGTSNERTLQQLTLDQGFQLVTEDSDGNTLTDNVKLLRALRDDSGLCDFAFGNYFVLKQLKNDQERRHPENTLSLRPFEKVGLDPLVPVLLRDHQWQRAVNYTIYALLYADQLNINSYNLTAKRESGSAIEKQFLRAEGMEGAGLEGEWLYRMIGTVGSYNEIYYRSIVCDYVACDMPSEQSFYDYLTSSETSRWPNKVFKANDSRPGMLVTPRF